MPTSQWRPPAGLIDRLLAAPQRFEFVQALRLIELSLSKAGVARGRILLDHVRIRQSVSLTFPASEIEALAADTVGSSPNGEAVMHFEQRQFNRFHITPTFMGLLGVSGVLPLHYTELVAQRLHLRKDEAPRAFLDTFATRALAIFYQAWSKYRVYYRVDKDGGDGLLHLQLAIAGVTPALRPCNPAHDSAVHNETAAYYAAILRHRAVSHSALAGVLGDYFDVPITLRQCVGQWDDLQPAQRCSLGVGNRTLGRNAMLGTREWRCDLCVELRIGPLEIGDYQRFLPGGEGTRALRVMLSLFPAPTLQFNVKLILHASAVRLARLTARQDSATLGLGQGMFLVTSQCMERVGMIYRMPS